MNKNTRNAIIVICIIFASVYGYESWRAGALINPFSFLFPPATPTEVQYSSFKYTGVREDATGTTVTSGTTRAWFDANEDGAMQYSEIGTLTESSGVYTSDKEYPINYIDENGNLVDFDIWVQIYASGYQVTYKNIEMTGQRNAGGEAKAVGQIECRQSDDSMTYDGLINSVAWDDSSDYNYTLKGTSGIAEVDIVLSAADKGISSQVWEGVNYQTVYGIDKTYDYYIKWDQITEGAGDTISVTDSAIMAPDFFAIYMTVQDKIDSAIDLADFDINFSDGTNWFCISFVSESWGDLMYNSADSSAPRPTVTFDMGTFTAAGTTAATYGVACWTAVTYEQLLSGAWTKSTTYALGTAGNDWDWTA